MVQKAVRHSTTDYEDPMILCYIGGGGSETDAKLQATVLLSWCEHRSQTVRSASKEVRIHLRSYLEFGVKGCL